MNAFSKAPWIHNTNVYEVNLRQYTTEGTFNAFSKELPRLRLMGVDTLWFMPVTPIAQKNKKGLMGSPYACSDYTAVNEEFGTLDDFKQLVQQAQGMGFKVMIDWVANHTGWGHVWTTSNPDFYKFDEATHDFKMASGMDDIIELDYSNTAMRAAMIDAMKFWVVECNIDGFRCDLAAWVQLDFWLEARAALEKTKTLFWLAECDGIENASYFQAFDACYCWTWMHKTEEFYKGSRDKTMLDGLLQQYNDATFSDGQVLWYTSNHDENSWNGTEYEKYGKAAAALAVFSCTWNGIPLLYSGQEMPNNKRLQFFEKDVIEWDGEYRLENFYKVLLQLHSHNPALRGADPAVSTRIVPVNAPHHILAYLRKNRQDEVLVLLNLSEWRIDCVLQDDHVKGNFQDVFTGEIVSLQEGSLLGMEPWQYFVLEKKA